VTTVIVVGEAVHSDFCGSLDTVVWKREQPGSDTWKFPLFAVPCLANLQRFPHTTGVFTGRIPQILDLLTGNRWP
jgi:hypothetical protein